MAFELNDTLSPLSRNERNKVNENWDRITNALNLLQSQINVIAGGDISDIVQELNDAMERLNEMLQDGEILIDDLDAAMLVINGYIDTLDDYVPRMESGVTDMEALLPVLTDLRDNLTTLNNNVTIAENGRVSAEGIRTTNENIRNANENIRQLNEVTRQATLEEMELLVDNFESYEYNPAVEYDFPNFVLYNGSTYLALQRVSGLVPTNDGTNWRLAAQRGVDGSGSVSSVNGINPDPNGNVVIPTGGDIINNLTSTRTDASLSANMGRELNNAKVNVSDKATTAEMQAGTNDAKWSTPLGTTNAITNRIATTTEVNTGTNTNKLISPLRLAELTGKKADLNTTNKDNLVAATNEVNNKVNQSEYQTPTVNARQIQITKPSALNRVFFKLSTALAEGTAITVSTDAGSTSKPLVDINENAVTSLDKGFHEIVESTSFFTLRNKGGGGVSPEDLQALITATNEVEANNDTLRENYIDTVNGLNVMNPLDAEASWNEILLKLPEINYNKRRFVSGTLTVPDTTLPFEFYTSTASSSHYPATVSDLSFKPSYIIVTPVDLTSSRFTVEYHEELSNYSEYVRQSIGAIGNNTGIINRGFKAQALSCYVNETGFRLPTGNTGDFIYYAYE